jgi:hypothetical protein
MMPLKKTLEWIASKCTPMSADLYYSSWFNKDWDLEEDAGVIRRAFVEALHVDFFSEGKLIGSLSDEGLNGSATSFVFDIDGKTYCVLDGLENLSLVIFDGLKWEDLDAAWNALAKAFNSEIWALRQERKAEYGYRKPKVKYF